MREALSQYLAFCQLRGTDPNQRRNGNHFFPSDGGYAGTRNLDAAVVLCLGNCAAVPLCCGSPVQLSVHPTGTRPKGKGNGFDKADYADRRRQCRAANPS